MRNRLLEISWEDVRLLSVEGNEIVITLSDGIRRLRFDSAKELNDAFGEWCHQGKEQRFSKAVLARPTNSPEL
jgi:hypothetical protein